MSRGERRLNGLGLTVATVGKRAADLGLSGDIAEQLGLDHESQAVVIVDVDPDGLAATKGMKIDDIITNIDQTTIASVDVLVRLVSDLKPGESALFWLWHQERGIDVRAMRIGGRRE